MKKLLAFIFCVILCAVCLPAGAIGFMIMYQLHCDKIKKQHHKLKGKKVVVFNNKKTNVPRQTA